MKVSQKGLYALQALMVLTRRYTQGAIRIRDIAYEENLPEKFLELILLELKNARIVESVRGAKGGYRLRRAPAEIRLSEIIRLIDGTVARPYRSRCGSQRPLQSVSRSTRCRRQDSGEYDASRPDKPRARR
jgi:Rrf2 family protein